MTLRYTFLSSDHKKDAVSKLENYGTKSHQFSQQGTQQESGGPHKFLNSNMLP